jgi:putative peptidoglycan lipid II flippase
VLAVVLGQISGPAGIAAAIAFGAWSNAVALIRRGTATFRLSIDAAARRRLPRILGAALAMAIVLWLTTRLMPEQNIHWIGQAILLGTLILCAIGMYGVLLALLGVIKPAEAAKALGPAGHSDLRDQGPHGN